MSLLQTFQQQFDRKIPAFFDQKINNAALLHPQAIDLLQMIREFMNNGGKRFRPALFYYAYQSSGKKGKIDPFYASFIFELFHTFALIHDDIIDNAALRRGAPTINQKHGTATAILAGDLALALTDEIFTEILLGCRLGMSAKGNLRKLYDTYKQELITGEYLDYVHIPEITVIMHLKTSMYSFVRPSMLGFLFGGDLPQEWEPVLGNLGILFQTKDDYEGIFGTEKKIGKSIMSDIEEGKNTKIIELFLNQAKPDETKRLQSFFGTRKILPADYRWFLTSLRNKNIDGQIRSIITNEARLLTEHVAKVKQRTQFEELILELISLISDFS